MTKAPGGRTYILISVTTRGDVSEYLLYGIKDRVVESGPEE